MKWDIRLRESDIEHIIDSFKNHFGQDDHLWLFGSRVDLAKKGGDIDLYVETTMSFADALKKKLRFIGDLWERIGEQKIDVVLHTLHSSDDLPIYKVAKKEGIQLV